MGKYDDVLAVILGGGRGARLYPLTKERSKPAVPFAGKYRLIDVPISNCINSDIYKIAVLTQFNSVSLHRHINATYNFDSFHQGYVQIWAAEQTMRQTEWYQGTADAVRKQLLEIRSTGAKEVLILSGDHLYRMDYRKMMDFHWQNDADITIAVQPVHKDDAGRFGILKVDKKHKIKAFAEKPKDPILLKKMVSRDEDERPYLGSMGVYIFKAQVLLEWLDRTDYQDFGGEVIPLSLEKNRVYAYDFDDYWEDIGTIKSFYDTNIALTQPNPPFNFYDPEHVIYTKVRFLPASLIENSFLKNVLLADGCCIKNARIENSVIGVRSQIRSGVKILNSVLMGDDYYDNPGYKEYRQSDVYFGIDCNCDIEGAIIDKNTCIGEGVIIKPYAPGTDLDADHYVVRDGIVVIPKNTIIQPGTYIGPE